MLSSAFVLIIQQSFSPELSLSLPVILLTLDDQKLLFQFSDSAHLLLMLLPVTCSKDIPQTSGRFLVTVETRLGLVGRNCVIRVGQYLIAWVQFRCGDCSP